MSSSNDNLALVRRIALTVLCAIGLVIVDLGLPLIRMYVGSSLFAAFLMYMFRKPLLRDILVIVILAPCAIALHCWLWFREWFRPDFFLILSGFGIAAFAVLTFRLIWDGPEKRRQIKEILFPAGALTAILFGSTWLNYSGKLWPLTHDLYLYSFDASLGFQGSFLVGKWFAYSPLFQFLSTRVYYSVLLGMVFAHIIYERRRPGNVSKYFMLTTCFVAAIIGYGFYQIVPACGPVYAFPAQFPFHGLPVHDVARLFLEPIPLSLPIPRNAMPSLHMTWALLIWWNLRDCGRLLHWSGFVFAIFTAFGTLGTGEHYLVDLVVAFPFALMIQAICCWHIPLAERRRWLGITTGLLITMAWLLMLRFDVRLFWTSPAVPWTCIALTLAASLYLSLPLTRIERAPGASRREQQPELATTLSKA